MALRKQPIDPICAMCRIIGMNFKPIHTKIGIIRNSVNLQEPNKYQGFLRFYNKDSKEDIFELFNVVVHLLVWFIIPDFTRKQQQNKEKEDAPPPQKETERSKFADELKKMIGYMCFGLEQLENTYKYGNVVLTLQYYINILNDGLSHKLEKEEILKKLPSCLISDLELDTPMKTKIVSSWNYNKLFMIGDLYDNCFRLLKENPPDRDELIEGYLSSIDRLLEVREREFKTLVKTFN